MVTKKDKFLLVLLALWLLIVSAFGILAWNHLQYKYNTPIEISGNAIDNYYNLYGRRDLFRIGDALYYDYYYDESSWLHGTIKITNQGAERIHWKGIELKGWRVTNPILSYQNQLIMFFDRSDGFDYHPKVYNEESHSFEEVSSFPALNPSLCRSYYQQCEEGFYFLDGSTLDRDCSLILYQNGEYFTILEGISWFYVQDNTIFYTTTDTDRHPEDDSPLHYTLYWRYDMSSKKSTKIISLNRWADYDTFFYQNLLILRNSYAVYTVDLSNAEKENMKRIIESNDAANLFNGVFYYSNENGVYRYCLEDGTTQLLCEREVISIYIFDDCWVYMQGRDGALWRIEQTGANLQHVYG
ncbi:MAG: hypothetical protein IKD31_03200 [Clostridia bacterium]|nr:hypothetical protein [Clostridia bacterium]